MNDREELIQEKIKEQEFIEMMQLRGAKQVVWDILTKDKGYLPNDIEIEPRFKLNVSDCEAEVSIDFIVNLHGRSFAVIRCANAGLDSWERYITAFARAIKDYQIPYAVVTDGNEARIIDVINGAIIGETLKGFFTRRDALEISENYQKTTCSEKRRKMEKRIIYAFEGIKCPTIKTEPPV
jgi:hypothetical protein